MDKKTLDSILKNAYNLPLWRQVLTEIFGARNLNQRPQPVILPSNKLAESAFEIGFLNTTDDRVVGLYQVDLKPNVKIERNRVALRELLRKIYKYDVDVALVVFIQGDKWRLSFVSEIRVLYDDGTINVKATEPKRYTYLLGKNEKVKTPTDRLYELAGKPIALEDVRNKFSVEVLNKEFYQKTANCFYKLTGSTAGKGKNAKTYARELVLPAVDPKNTDNDKFYKQFAVRLIGRIVFCWFLKEKRPDGGGNPLMPEELLSLQAVENNSNYYHTILERLFFQTLNERDDRRDDLPPGCEQIPFLNGGLFEPQEPGDYYQPNRATGLSQNLNTLIIPNSWFEEFFGMLEEYNFTIDENSTVDVEISVDPEMLGRIFENLLAEIDQDTGEMARKATGSFYTPREIVDYMATESLVLYLHNETGVEREKLAELFKVLTEAEFSDEEKEKLLDALERLKILDPACGSGAFPMGVLQKILHALRKLDEKAEWWKARQLKQINNAIIRRQVKEKLDDTNAEYIRKIGIIQNTLYGVDIQPIAAEISKLRCFLTLIVDETIDDRKPNRGVEPLPNLEFKFVTADSLLKLPESPVQRGFVNSDGQLETLHEIRQEYLQAYGDEKDELKQRFVELQREISDQQDKNITRDARAEALSDWKPFSYEKTDWFHSEWMFGVKAFDIVIANPPYGAKFDDNIKKYLFSTYPLLKGQPESYEYFLYLGINTFCNKLGTLSYIVPTNFIESKRAENLREYILKKGIITAICSFRFNVWDTNAAETLIFNYTKNHNNKNDKTLISHPKKLSELTDRKNFEAFNQNDWLNSVGKRFIIRSNPKTLNKISEKTINLGSIVEVSQGIIVYKTREDSEKNLYISDTPKDKTWVKLLDSKSSLSKYLIFWGGNYLKYGNWLWCARDEKFFASPKIVFGRLRNKSLKYKLIGAYDNSNFYNRDNFNNIISKDKNYDLKYILALFNSELINYWYKAHFDNVNINPEQVRLIPIKICEKSLQTLFRNLVDFIIFLKSQPLPDVTDKLMPVYFEQIIDGMVYELYFGELLAEHGREIIKHLGELPALTDNADDERKMKIIRTVFNRLNDREHPVRNNLFYLDSIPEIRIIEGKDENN